MAKWLISNRISNSTINTKYLSEILCAGNFIDFYNKKSEVFSSWIYNSAEEAKVEFERIKNELK